MASWPASPWREASFVTEPVTEQLEALLQYAPWDVMAMVKTDVAQWQVVQPHHKPSDCGRCDVLEPRREAESVPESE
ncbi:hypothetical protein Gpo141_00009503 [Globisporangium polare]